MRYKYINVCVFACVCVCVCVRVSTSVSPVVYWRLKTLNNCNQNFPRTCLVANVRNINCFYSLRTYNDRGSVVLWVSGSVFHGRSRKNEPRAAHELCRT